MDLVINDYGSILVVMSDTERGNEWIEDNLNDVDTLTWAGGVAVEPRYIAEIMTGAISDGLTVSMGA